MRRKRPRTRSRNEATSMHATKYAEEAGHRRQRRDRLEDDDSSESGSEPETRPATACLEAPRVLDRRLVDQLDMSLLNKDSLEASLILIRQNLAKSMQLQKASEPRDPSRETLPTEPTGQRACSPNSKVASRRYPPSDDINNNNNNSSSSSSSSSSTSNSHSNGSKRSKFEESIDLARNKLSEKPAKSTKLTSTGQLSPLRFTRASMRSDNSSEISLIAASSPSTGRRQNSKWPTPRAARPVNEASCKSCLGSAHQPERFHSHSRPRSPEQSKHPKGSRSSVSIIPVRSSLAKAECRRKTSAKSGGIGSPSPVDSFGARAAPQERQKKCPDTASAVEAARPACPQLKASSDDSSKTNTSKKRPRSVTCYICGREFGSASFPIHEPKCLERWHRENKSLPSSQRRNEPQRPNFPIDHEEWNTAAWEQSQALLIPCSKCKRTFLPDRLGIHERNCRNSKGHHQSTNIARLIARNSSQTSKLLRSVAQTKMRQCYATNLSQNLTATASGKGKIGLISGLPVRCSIGGNLSSKTTTHAAGARNKS